jgi:mannan endo-1,4-beta-mannosidase
MKTTVTKLLATVAAASTIFGMSTLPAFAAEGKSASNGNSVNISDVNATAETRALFNKLKNSGKGDLRFGQQHTTDENISSSASQGDVYEMTGKYPAVFGWDAGLALRGAEKPGSGADKNANTKALAQNITDADSKGAIVTTDRGQNVKLKYSCNGYFTGILDLNAAGINLDQSKLTLTPQVKTKDGKTLAAADGNGSVTVKLGAKPEQTVDNVEDFDSYDNEAELQSVYSPNHSTKSNLTLVDSPEDNGTKAGNIRYDFVSYPEYNGFQRSYTPKQDWSGFSKLNMFLKADGSDHKFVVQVNAGGVTFEAYPKIDGTDGHVVSLNFGDADGNGGDFAPASWDTAHAGMKLSQKLLSKVGSFALYINDNGGNRPKSGDLTLDSIKLDGKRDAYAPNTNPTPGNTAKAQSVDDFSGYSDDAAAQSAWGNRGHTEVLSLDEGPTAGSKALRFKYDFSNGGWYDVAKYLDGANWSGESVLAFQVKGDGSDNAIGLQIGTSDGKYFLASVKLDFTGWKQIEIPLVDKANLTQSWPEDANKDNPMTEDDLASIKELVFASQQWNSESDGLDFSIADIKVEPAENTSNEQTPKDESKTEVKADKEQEQSEDTSADVTAQDPATCPISDEDSKGSTGNTTVTVKPTPDAKEPADNTGKDGLSRTGSNIISAIAAVAVLLLGGCAVLIARKRKGGDIE